MRECGIDTASLNTKLRALRELGVRYIRGFANLCGDTPCKVFLLYSINK